MPLPQPSEPDVTGTGPLQLPPVATDPGLAAMPGLDPQVRDQLQQLAALVAAGKLVPPETPASVCLFEPATVCGLLAPELRDECEAWSRDFVAGAGIRSGLRGPTRARPPAWRCAGTPWTSTRPRLRYRPWGCAMPPSPPASPGSRRMSWCTACRAGSRRSIKPSEEIEARAPDRTVHYYENRNTGALIEHAGRRFEPYPPLVYVGLAPGRLTTAERGEIARLEEERTRLEARIEEARAIDTERQSWLADARAFWSTSGPGTQWPCTLDMAQESHAHCRENCSREVPNPAGLFSCAPSILAVLQGQQPWILEPLYPPGMPPR